MTICHPSLAAISSIDWGIIVLNAIGMVAVGFYYSRKINNTEDYLLGGAANETHHGGTVTVCLAAEHNFLLELHR